MLGMCAKIRVITTQISGFGLNSNHGSKLLYTKNNHLC